MKTEKEIKIIESNINIYQRDGLFKKGEYSNLIDFSVKTAFIPNLSITKKVDIGKCSIFMAPFVYF